MKHTLYTTAILACMAAANMPAMVSASANMAVETAMAQENTQQHFLTDAAYRQRVEEDFRKRKAIIGGNFCNVAKLSATQAELEALQFLYAYMPLADITDHTVEYYLANVRASNKARQQMAWGKNVPELLFRHFVLPVRVNNEELDDARSVFYDELKDRIAGLSMRDAILEINHWCHEKVTYQPSDPRTSSPLATVRSAYGRCGEESTLLVAALRAMGIPARQVYTPRWAHTDDNHAWVEAWADGKWYFLGACEPEPVLDLGWFNAPASRALLMHTRVFGYYDGPEEVLLRTPCNTEINLIGNYGETANVDFTIVDENGVPVSGARVDFCIYNYAEYCPVVAKFTDAAGHTSLTAGKGDMMVWASKDGKYGFAKVAFATDKALRISLSHSVAVREQSEATDSFDIVPPPEKANVPFVSPEQRAENNRRFEYEDSLRHAYLATFYTHEKAVDALKGKVAGANAEGLQRLATFLEKSSGNHQVILDFITKNAVSAEKTQRVTDLLATLSDKDLRDIRMAILDDSYAAGTQLSPRVENEMITRTFKAEFRSMFSDKEKRKFQKNPLELVKWIKKNIRMNPDKKSPMIAQTPMGAYDYKITDRRSRNILFVDMARSFDIEARVDPVTGKTQYKAEGKWADVNFEKVVKQVAPQGTLMLRYEKNAIVDDPKYFSHFTISRINANGTTSLLEYPEEGTTWGTTFKDGVSLDAGQYLLVTGMRLASGAVKSEARLFSVEDGKTTDLDLKIRTSPTDVSVIGSFNSEAKFQTLDGREVTFLSQTGRGYFITGLIGVGQEPTNHALKDIAKVAAEFDKWGRPLVLLFEDEAAAKKFNAKEFPGLPKNIIFGIDAGGAVRQEISENMKLSNKSLSPIFFISDTFNRVVFLKQGYTISLGEQMEQVIRTL